jgi:2-polyprenyl-6-methoxyphenol hydroxylase-like FAD-dependent oxidoreductase
MLAAELHRHESPCRVIERRANAAPYCKALGITPRTLEVWDDLGVVQHALAAGLRLLGLMADDGVALRNTIVQDLRIRMLSSGV